MKRFVARIGRRGVAALAVSGLAGLSAAVIPAVTVNAHAAAVTTTTINVQVGGTRATSTTVNGLHGVQLALYNGTSSAPTTAVGTAWSTCTSDATGLCQFIVPDTESGNPAGANHNARFWVVQTGEADGYYDNLTLDTGDPTATTYAFRTPALTANVTVTSGSSTFMGSGANSGGIWQNSLNEPGLTSKCGLKVALIVDLSGSVGPYIADLKSAATAFINGLSGTPSSVSLYTFGANSPAPGQTNHTGLTSVADAAGTATVNGWINGLTVNNNSTTNWDAGFYAAAQQMDSSGNDYDAAVIITDGDPTTFGDGTGGTGNSTSFQDVEDGIFSSNAIKAHGTQVIAFGVGVGVTGSVENLRAISGPSGGANGPDYYQSTDYAAAGSALRALALGNCTGSLTVVKEVIPANGTTANATPAGGWNFSTSTTTAGVTINPNSGTTTLPTGAVNFPLTYPGGTSSASVTATETQQAGYTLFQQGGANATCFHLDVAGAKVTDTVTDVGTTGFTVAVPASAAESCLVYNQAAAQPTLALTKVVHNSNGGTAVASDFTLTATPNAIAGQSAVSGAGGFAATTVDAGSYTLSESGPGGYSASAWNCTGNGTPINGDVLTLATGETVSCTITNTDEPASLTLTKTVVNSNGGTAMPSNFTLTATGPTTISGVSGSAAVTGASVSAGTYVLSESGPAGYTSTGWVCTDGRTNLPVTTNGNGQPTIQVPVAGDVSCTVTNTDDPSTLTLTKTVLDMFGGTAVPSDFTLTATGPTTISGVSGSAAVTGASVSSGTYSLSESGPAGYTGSPWTCSDAAGALAVTNASVTIPFNTAVTCGITNTDVPSSLTLTKTVVNANGGTAKPSDFTLTATGPTTISGPSGSAAVTGASVSAGTYVLSESGPAGYQSTGWVCTDGRANLPVTTNANGQPTIQVAQGGDVSCTVTNTDVPSTLTLTKTVQDEFGGTAVPSDFTLTATGPSTVSGPSGSAAVTNALVSAGTYSLSESGPAGYTGSPWTCSDAAGSIPVTNATVTLPFDSAVTCSITNTDDPGSLTLTKIVDNSHGGKATPSDFTLTASGPTTISGPSGSAAVTGASVSAGTYVLSETGPAGYQGDGWSCTDGGANLPVTADANGDPTILVNLASDVVCTVTNTDDPASLTLTKIVDNGSTGRTATPADFTLTATPNSIAGQPTVSGNGDPSTAGGVNAVVVFAGSYTLSESGPSGYTAGDWKCTGGTVSGSTVVIANDAVVSCSITNTAQATGATQGNGGHIATTGTPVEQELGVSAGLLFAGGLLLVVGRRSRRRRQS